MGQLLRYQRSSGHAVQHQQHRGEGQPSPLRRVVTHLTTKMWASRHPGLPHPQKMSSTGAIRTPRSSLERFCAS
jgi:hypothetical protein